MTLMSSGRPSSIHTNNLHPVLLSRGGATGWIRWQIGESRGHVHAARGGHGIDCGTGVDAGAPGFCFQAILEDEARGGGSREGIC